MCLLLLLPLIFGFLAVYQGQDNSWDLRNYHYYIAFAFDTGRLGSNIHMGQLQGYLNPTIDLVFYHLIQTFTPRTATFILGYIQGINASLLLLISLLFVRPLLAPGARIIGAVVATAAGCYAPTMISMAGTSSNDITASLFVLASILLIFHLKNMTGVEANTGRVMLVSAGIVMGMGVGLKLTLAPYAVGLIVALMFTGGSWKSRVEVLIVVSTGLMAGVLISLGHWMGYLWQNFESPMFPFYNKIFQSPFYHLENFADLVYMPKSLAHHLAFPFIRGFENSYTSMQKNHLDWRYGIVYTLLIISMVKPMLQSIGRKNERDKDNLPGSEQGLFLVVFFIASYTLWQLMFSVWRYANPLEQLAPLVVIILVSRLVKAVNLRLAVITLLWAVMALSVRADTWSRLPFKDSFFRIQIPQVENLEKSAIIVAGGRPWSYLVAAFPPTTQFIRISSNMIKPGDSTRLVDRIRTAVDTHEGPLYLLTRRQYLAAHLKELQAYGLTYSANQAAPIYSEHEPPGLFLLPLKWQ